MESSIAASFTPRDHRRQGQRRCTSGSNRSRSTTSRWKGPYDPVPTTTFDNATGAATNYVITYSYTDAQGNEAPLRLEDGYNYQLAYIQAGFSTNFDLSHYPFDSQKLDIRFENTTYAYNQLVYVPDPSGSSDKGFTVSEWNTSGIATDSFLK
jgi:hypothetical protein